MFSQSIYPLLNIIILFSFFRGAEFHSPIASSGKPEIISMHWKHPSTNSAIDIQGIEVDVFQWCAASRSNKSVKVKLLSPVWESIGLQNTNVQLPETVQISEAVDYRGTPIVYIKIIPWRLTGNMVEVLSNGEIVIETETVDFPITFKQSILINGITSSLPRNITNTQYLILTTQRDSAAAQLLANMHSDEVDLQYQLKTDVILMEKIEMDYPDLQLNYAIREFLLNLSTEYSDLMFVLFSRVKKRIFCSYVNKNDSYIYNALGDDMENDFFTFVNASEVLFDGTPEESKEVIAKKVVKTEDKLKKYFDDLDVACNVTQIVTC